MGHEYTREPMHRRIGGATRCAVRFFKHQIRHFDRAVRSNDDQICSYGQPHKKQAALQPLSLTSVSTNTAWAVLSLSPSLFGGAVVADLPCSFSSFLPGGIGTTQYFSLGCGLSHRSNTDLWAPTAQHFLFKRLAPQPGMYS